MTEPLIQSYDDVRRLTRDLETIADWLDDLRSRIDRAHLRFQVFGLDVEEQEALEAEVLEFKQVCAAICGDPPATWERKAGCVSYSPLDIVESYVGRFVAYPSEHALVAHVLWIAHTHLIECFDTTPRLAFISAEKEFGQDAGARGDGASGARPYLVYQRVSRRHRAAGQRR